MSSCYSCDQQAVADPPPRESILRTPYWVLAHAFNSTLPGWLVLVPTTHVTAFSDLTAEAADELGGLVRRASLALATVTGCTKTYLMQFSEADGFEHLHLHLVPRMGDQPAELRGRRVFGYLSDNPAACLSADERDALALTVRAALSGA